MDCKKESLSKSPVGKMSVKELKETITAIDDELSKRKEKGYYYNALLKWRDEGPRTVKFLFCTDEGDKLERIILEVQSGCYVNETYSLIYSEFPEGMTDRNELMNELARLAFLKSALALNINYQEEIISSLKEEISRKYFESSE